jgi:hypothetical protein
MYFLCILCASAPLPFGFVKRAFLLNGDKNILKNVKNICLRFLLYIFVLLTLVFVKCRIECIVFLCVLRSFVFFIVFSSSCRFSSFYRHLVPRILLSS